MSASAADPASDRIFKGYVADPHDFPWMVKLKVSPASVEWLKRSMMGTKQVAKMGAGPL